MTSKPAPPAGLPSEPDEEGAGGADALILISIIFEPDGGRSDLVLSIDGRTGTELPDIEVFKSWVMLAHKLMNSEQISDDGRYLAQKVFEHVQARVLHGREP